MIKNLMTGSPLDPIILPPSVSIEAYGQLISLKCTVGCAYTSHWISGSGYNSLIDIALSTSAINLFRSDCLNSTIDSTIYDSTRVYTLTINITYLTTLTEILPNVSCVGYLQPDYHPIFSGFVDIGAVVQYLTSKCLIKITACLSIMKLAML